MLDLPYIFQAWDDVVRKEKPKEDAYEYKKRLTLDHEKSKLSLAEIYEQEYIKLNQVRKPLSRSHVLKGREVENHLCWLYCDEFIKHRNLELLGHLVREQRVYNVPTECWGVCFALRHWSPDTFTASQSPSSSCYSSATILKSFLIHTSELTDVFYKIICEFTQIFRSDRFLCLFTQILKKYLWLNKIKFNFQKYYIHNIIIESFLHICFIGNVVNTCLRMTWHFYSAKAI